MGCILSRHLRARIPCSAPSSSTGAESWRVDAGSRFRRSRSHATRYVDTRFGSPRSVEVHRAGEMVDDLSRQLVADTATRTAEVCIRPGTAQDAPGKGVGRGTEYKLRLELRRERPRAIGTREGLEDVEVDAESALKARGEL